MDPALFHILALAALNGVSTGYFIHGRQQERRLNDKRLLVQELTERRELEDRYSILRPEYERWVKPDPEPDGGVPMILAGTGGTSLGQQEAVEACRASADGSYGPILLAEPNNDSRRRYLQAVAQLLGWRGKVIEETFPRCPGFQGRTPTKALHPSFLPYWEPDLRRTAQERFVPAIRLRRDKPRYGKCKLSSGGSGVTGLVGIEELKQEFPGVPVYGELVLDEGDRRRQENIPELLKHYSELADGICLYDNRRHPWLTDQAQALWGPAAVTAPWFDPRAPEDFNAWGDVHDTHKFSTIRACFKRVKVEHRQAWRDQLPPLHYTLTSQLEFAILQAIQDVLTNATSQSLPLQEAEPRFIYVILPVRPEPDLLKIAQGVQQAVKPQLGFNTKLAFASIGKPLAMHTQEVGIAVVSFFPLAADLKAIEDYLTERQPVDPRFLTPPSIAQGGNGYAGPVTATPPVETGAAERAHA